MDRAIYRRSSCTDRSRGVALLMVLLIVLAVTIISAGFIARADVELACGGNMLLHAQMDQLAHSGLEHAKGLLLRPQGVSALQINGTDWYWVGAQRMPLISTSDDLYDVSVARDATDYCIYHVACEAYREVDGKRLGQTRLTADLRLDPCIALWTKVDTTLRQNWIVQGDVRTDGTLTSQAPTASLDGDVFATQLIGTSVGQTYAAGDLSLTWPPVTSTYSSPLNPFSTVTGTLSGTYSSNPKRIYKCSGDLSLAAGTTIQGMLLVTGNLTVTGSGCSIIAARNLPALYVGGNLLLDNASDLSITGLAVVDGNLRIHSDASNVRFVGGLCLGGAITETTPDASGNGNRGTLMNDPQWATDGSRDVIEFDGVNDYVEVPHHPSLCVTTEATVMAWIKTPRYAYPGHNYQGILAKSNDFRSYSFYTMSGGSLHFSTGPYPHTPSISSGSIPLDEWVHVCAMVRGGAHVYFIDGAPAGSGASDVTLPGESDTAPVVIGKASEDNRQFAGLVDDVRIYNRALGDEEVAAIASGGHVSTGLVGHWTLDGPGSQVTILADPVKASVVAYEGGVLEYWSPAAGAFFRGIQRQ